MQKEELLRDVADKKSKIEELEGKVKDSSMQSSELLLKVEQLAGRETSL